jgi:hypothetical protein
MRTLADGGARPAVVQAYLTFFVQFLTRLLRCGSRRHDLFSRTITALLSPLRNSVHFQLTKFECVGCEQITARAVQPQQIGCRRRIGDNVGTVMVRTAPNQISSVALRAFNATANSAGHERLVWKGPCSEPSLAQSLRSSNGNGNGRNGTRWIGFRRVHRRMTKPISPMESLYPVKQEDITLSLGMVRSAL